MSTGTRLQFAFRTSVVIAAAILVVVRAASGGYSSIELYPLTPPVGHVGNFDSKYQAATGWFAGQSAVVAGYSSVPAGDIDLPHAAFWDIFGHPTDLTGSGVAATAFAAVNVEQVGQTIGSHAILWRGSPQSAVDLNPGFLGVTNSAAVWTDGENEVGWGSGPLTQGRPVALIWKGTAASARVISPVDPPGITASAALAAFGEAPIHVVGWGSAGNQSPQHALFWNIVGGDAIDLHPKNFVSSVADAISVDQEAGYGETAGNFNHAVIWHNTAGSAVDLNPSQLGIVESYALATNGTKQAGWGAFKSAEGYHSHALVWTGSASSAVDLNLVLPAGFTQSQAYSIDGDGNVFGVASGPAGPAAFEWTTHSPLVPGDADFSRRVDFRDLLVVARNYGQPGGWADGDFNGDGKVNFDDLLVLASHYGEFHPLDSAAAQDNATGTKVPEPGSLIGLSASLIVIGRRRRT